MFLIALNKNSRKPLIFNIKILDLRLFDRADAIESELRSRASAG